MCAQDDHVYVTLNQSLSVTLTKTVQCRRKNIGYLWAIAHGAKVIYETDDDNLLTEDAITVLEPGIFLTYYSADFQRTINVYDTYGLPHMWPRGLPLADVKTKAPLYFSKKMTAPLIQQGENSSETP